MDASAVPVPERSKSFERRARLRRSAARIRLRLAADAQLIHDHHSSTVPTSSPRGSALAQVIALLHQVVQQNAYTIQMHYYWHNHENAQAYVYNFNVPPTSARTAAAAEEPQPDLLRAPSFVVPQAEDGVEQHAEAADELHAQVAGVLQAEDQAEDYAQQIVKDDVEQQAEEEAAQPAEDEALHADDDEAAHPAEDAPLETESLLRAQILSANELLPEVYAESYLAKLNGNMLEFEAQFEAKAKPEIDSVIRGSLEQKNPLLLQAFSYEDRLTSLVDMIVSAKMESFAAGIIAAVCNPPDLPVNLAKFLAAKLTARCTSCLNSLCRDAIAAHRPPSPADSVGDDAGRAGHTRQQHHVNHRNHPSAPSKGLSKTPGFGSGPRQTPKRK